VAELNHHNDPTGLAASAKAAGKATYLGSQELTDRLVRSFVADVMSRFDQVGQGRLVPNDAAAADRAGCEKLADIFLGNDKSFEPVKGWNGKPLADFIRSRMYSAVQDEDDRSVVAQAFAVLVHHVYDAIRAGESEAKMIDDINGAIKSLCWTLHGVEVNE
jgi:hypothetical protein